MQNSIKCEGDKIVGHQMNEKIAVDQVLFFIVIRSKFFVKDAKKWSMMQSERWFTLASSIDVVSCTAEEPILNVRWKLKSVNEGYFNHAVSLATYS